MRTVRTASGWPRAQGGARRLAVLVRLAARGALRNRRRSLLTLLAVLVAVFVLAMVRGMLNALNASLRDNVVAAQIGAIQIHKRGYLKAVLAAPLELDIPATGELIARIRAIPHVTAVAPRIPFGGLANRGDRSVFTPLLAVDPVAEAQVCPRRFAQLASGRPTGAGSPAASVFTQPLLTRLGAAQGAKIAILAADRDGVLGAAEVDAGGTLPDPGALAADKKLAIVPLAVAQELLRMPGRATEIAVGVDADEQVDAAAAGLRAALGPELEVSTWRQLTAFLDDTMQKQDLAVSWVAGTFLFVALLGIANTMLMNVRERTREIGTMMAVGLRRRQILALFLVEAALLGTAGAALGLAAGAALVGHLGSTGIEMRVTGGTSVFELRPFLTLEFVGRTFAVAVAGAVLAALHPALRASRMRPIEALSQAV